VASLSQGRTAAAQCGLFTYKSVPVIFEPPCITHHSKIPNQEVSVTALYRNLCIQHISITEIRKLKITTEWPPVA